MLFRSQLTKILGDIVHGQEFSSYAMEIYEANYEKGKIHYVRPFHQHNSVFQVCTTYIIHTALKGETIVMK